MKNPQSGEKLTATRTQQSQWNAEFECCTCNIAEGK
ncbi:hypothetical protein F442_21264 [Phytophthora nicotianae P10297]|uniref:Uncharacterized protein n=4 Tax=Phytophthora nicotianae TaxID=4792 RepID=W2Y5Y5_PHYNI|nr:hypothetical protein L915_20829 [Phytophthora nicotianae]ETP29599.1 hypothetical protein F442_21264 [Phytophthora nicotianae P10297]